ncbi:MAG: bifunctional UDP-sugar hydrolase/5'-nucleotidase [Eubacteriales bacterium]|nr:bifunctional UDP-sugar hydrolase/5'-nucleotidase [Eubacteriales bacterium]
MPESIRLTLLHSNDMHGDFLAETVDQALTGGVSLLSGYLNRVRQEENNVLYAISGDMFKGSIIDSEFKGISTIELMNALAPDIVTLGNHEIDYGVAHLLFLEKCAKFPIINANLFIKSNHVRLFTPYRIFEIGGLKIMFIGIITEEVLLQTKSEEIIGSFIDVAEAAREVAVICDTYKTTDIACTVLLTHIGFDKDCALAKLIDPRWGVDMIIGGHTHTLMDKPHVENGIPIVQAGTGTDQIGRFDLEFDATSRKLLFAKWQCIAINSDTCPADPAIEELLQQYKSHTDQKYGRRITRLARTLTHPARNQETELGNLIADLLQTDSSFDIMLFGSGSIRRASLGPVVCYQDLKELCPYDDPLYMLEVTGAQFKRMMRFMLRDEGLDGHGEFYQVSHGVRMVYSRKAQDFTTFEYQGEPLSDSRMLTVALQKYHFDNFDAFFGLPLAEVSKNKKPRVIATSVCGILEELLASSNKLNAQVEGRITIQP